MPGGVKSGGGAGVPGASTVSVTFLDDVFPDESRAVTTMVVGPIGRFSGVVVVSVTAETRSVPEMPARYAAIAGSVRAMPAALVAVNDASGALIPGAVVSATVTLNETDPMLPTASLTVQVTVVVPSGNVVPDGGEHVIWFGRSASPPSEPVTA